MSERLRNIYAQGSIPEFKNDGDDMDRYYLPLRALVFGINGKSGSLVVVPETEQTRNYVEQFQLIIDELGSRSSEVLMVPDSNYFLDEAIRQNLPELRRRLNKQELHNVHPYSHTQNLRSWVDPLRQQGFIIDIPLNERVYHTELDNPQHRIGWSRSVSQPDVMSFAERNRIAYPASFAGVGKAEISTAYQLLVESTGRSEAFVKPGFSAGGFTIEEISSLKELERHYNRMYEQGSLMLFGQEMPIEIQASVTNLRTLASIQYDGDTITTPGGVSLQLMEGNSWVGNVFNTRHTKELEPQARELFNTIKNGYLAENRRLGRGGFDLYENDEGVGVLEHNGDRVVGADPANRLAEYFGFENQPYMIRKTGEPRSDLLTYWRVLKREGIAYDQQVKRGVFPLLWISGSGFLVTAGNNETDIRQMTDKALEAAAVNGYME